MGAALGNTLNFLNRRGLTNNDWSYEQMTDAQPKKFSVALCTSLMCNGSRANSGKFKDTKKEQCPDCGSFVRFKLVNKEELDRLKL